MFGILCAHVSNFECRQRLRARLGAWRTNVEGHRGGGAFCRRLCGGATAEGRRTRSPTREAQVVSGYPVLHWAYVTTLTGRVTKQGDGRGGGSAVIQLPAAFCVRLVPIREADDTISAKMGRPSLGAAGRNRPWGFLAYSETNGWVGTLPAGRCSRGARRYGRGLLLGPISVTLDWDNQIQAHSFGCSGCSGPNPLVLRQELRKS